MTLIGAAIMAGAAFIPVQSQSQSGPPGVAAATNADTSAGHGPAFFRVRAEDGDWIDAHSAPALQRRISLTLIGVPLGIAVQGIADRAGLDATFSPDIIPRGARVSMKADDVTVVSALRWVLINTQLDVLLEADGRLTLVPRSAQAAVADSSGVLIGTLIDGEDAQPVPYGTVTLLGTDVGRFTDRSGHFRIARLPAKVYPLRARQIGYSPVDTSVAVGADSASTLTIRMHRLPALLRVVRVQGRRPNECVATGVPDSTVNKPLAAVFAQVRENVDRYALLLDEYPFRYVHEESLEIQRVPGRDSTEFADTVTYDSRERRRYRVGEILYHAATLREIAPSKGEGGDHALTQADAGVEPFVSMGAQVEERRHMYIPTFADLAEPAFLAAHCFEYGGTSRAKRRGAPTLIRVDFRPASSIKVPDVSGSIYLDADSLVVRQAVFELTKPEAASPPVLGFKVTTTFRELLPLVPMVDSFRSQQPLMARDHGSVAQAALGSDRLIGFAFERLTPGEQQVSSATPAAAAGSPAPGDTARRDAQALAAAVGPYVTRVHPVLPAGESCTLPPAVDTISVLLYATIYGHPPQGMADTAWSRYESGVLGAFSQSFDLPADLPLAAFSWPFEYAPRADHPLADAATRPESSAPVARRLAVVTVEGRNTGSFVVPMMSTAVGMTLSADGSLRSAAIAASSASGVADTAVLIAVRRAATANPFPRIARSVRDTAPSILDLVVSMGEPPPGDQTTIVRRLDAPTWPSRGHAQLDFLPDLAKELRHGDPRADTVALEFVVNEQGRALSSTARPEYAGARHADDYKSGFARRLIQSLSDFRFNEAHISGCAVPQFIRQGFGYRTSWHEGRGTTRSWSASIP